MPKLSLQTCLYFLSSTLALVAITESSLIGGLEEQKMKVNMQALLHLENSMEMDYLFSLFLFT